MGLPLSEQLVEAGYQIKGSTTTPGKVKQLEEAGIEPYLLTLAPELQGDADAFFDADVLFLNVPPGRRRGDVKTRHLREMESVLEALQGSSIDFVIFASSTGVYPKNNSTVTEAFEGAPDRPTGEVLREVESRFMEAEGFDTTVLRFAGLYGYDRRPGRFLAGRENVPNGEAPVNLVHRDDCIGVVRAVIEGDVRGEVFNVCADKHPLRRTLYVREAERMGLEPPTFSDDEAPEFKHVSNEKLRQQLGYRFLHPDPLEETP